MRTILLYLSYQVTSQVHFLEQKFKSQGSKSADIQNKFCSYFIFFSTKNYDTVEISYIILYLYKSSSDTVCVNFFHSLLAPFFLFLQVQGLSDLAL